MCAHQNSTTWKYLSLYLGHVNKTDQKEIKKNVNTKTGSKIALAKMLL